MNPKYLLFGVAIITLGLTLLQATAEARRHGDSLERRKSSAHCPRLEVPRCCMAYHWGMTTDPAGWEDKHGCLISCCRRHWMKEQTGLVGRKSKMEHGVMRGIIKELLACATELALNLSMLRLELPQSCCSLPLVGFLPFCMTGPPPPPMPAPPMQAPPPNPNLSYPYPPYPFPGY